MKFNLTVATTALAITGAMLSFIGLVVFGIDGNTAGIIASCITMGVTVFLAAGLIGGIDAPIYIGDDEGDW